MMDFSLLIFHDIALKVWNSIIVTTEFKKSIIQHLITYFQLTLFQYGVFEKDYLYEWSFL